jgi:hypothetical protein
VANSYPRSLLGLMVLGSTMAMLPLLAALLSMQQAQHVRDQMHTSAIRLDDVVRQRGGHFRLQLPIASGETE